MQGFMIWFRFDWRSENKENWTMKKVKYIQLSDNGIFYILWLTREGFMCMWIKLLDMEKF